MNSRRRVNSTVNARCFLKTDNGQMIDGRHSGRHRARRAWQRNLKCGKMVARSAPRGLVGATHSGAR
jgi:hypothetical protein